MTDKIEMIELKDEKSVMDMPIWLALLIVVALVVGVSWVLGALITYVFGLDFKLGQTVALGFLILLVTGILKEVRK